MLRKSKQRRGVTLLFVISFIVLFLLMGTAFVVVSTQFLRTSRQRARLESDRTPGKLLVQRAVHDIIRGPSLDNIFSPLRGNDLLSDQYGYSAKAIVTTATTQGEFVRLEISSLTPTANTVTDVLTNTEFTLSQYNGAYDGMVLTFVSQPPTATGRVKGVSTRIVRYETDGSSFYFYVPSRWSDVDFDYFLNPALEMVNAEILINGRPFVGSGTGVFNSTATGNTPRLSVSALQPNRAGEARNDLIQNYMSTDGSIGLAGSMFVRAGGAGFTTFQDFGFVGGAPNESYDAPDFQNMFLAYDDPGTGGFDIASFYQPKLIEYTIAQAGGVGSVTPAQLAPVMFRPFYIASDAANSTANAEFPTNDNDGDGIVDFYDVDNDGDGVRDSVWVDFGMPIQYDLSGRRYKPLVAAMIVDMDGRLNINAHGNIFDAEDNRQASDRIMAGGLRYPDLPRGQMLGPPEISLRGLFRTSPPDYSNLVNTRYGADGLPGLGGATSDPWTGYKLFDYPGGTTGLVNVIGSSFSTPLDIHGRFSFAYPSNGPPSFMPSLDVTNSFATARLGGESSNSAYEMQFAGYPFTTSADTPFRANELEALLRRYDKDVVALPGGRLGINSLIDNTNLITTDSWEVPTSPGYLAESFYLKLLVDGGFTPSQARTQMALLASPEMLRGLRFDINRPFGNGADDNGNGLIDEITEESIAQSITHPNGTPYAMEQADFGNRRAYMRQLFSMGYLILLRRGTLDLNGDGNIGVAQNPDEDDVRFLAQWVANVVDFRDADSIYTPFEYDNNPMNGWGVDGNPGTDENVLAAPYNERRVVWGLERPEALITETVGIHDRKTEDTADDSSGELSTSAGGTDPNYDNRLRPSGVGFIEIYNPWQFASPENQRIAPEIQEASGAVDLDRRSGNIGTGDPVWRMLIVKGPSIDLDPDDPDPAQLPNNTDVERSIYFVQPNANYNQYGYGEGKRYFTNQAVNSLAGGSYAVIGGFNNDPSTTTGGGFRTTIGRRVGVAETDENTLQLADTRSITLFPGAATGVRIRAFDQAATNMVTYSRNAVGIVLNQAMDSTSTPEDRSFSFSEPVDGYPGLDPNGIPAAQIPDSFRYPEPYDLPLDMDPAVQTDMNDRTAINNNGSTPKFRVVHLQRLADPTQPWDQNTNPYLTVDRSYVDLVAFNGTVTGTEASNEEMHGVNDGTTLLATMERGASETGRVQTRRRLWPTEPDTVLPGADQISLAGADSHNFSYEWEETLGDINDAYMVPRSGANPYTSAAFVSFPWLMWNNRPFSSQLELAYVPVTRSSQLLSSFSVARRSNNVYDAQSTSRFGHLANWFADSQSGQGINNRGGGDLFRLLDFIEVPSRFTGTEEFFVPAAGTPPYDRISRYRDPGKMNINTINSRISWNGLMGTAYTSAAAGRTYSSLNASRVSGVGGLPTAIPSPFRAANSGTHVPIAGLVRRNADTTVFRSTTAGGNTPLFDLSGTSRFNDPSRSPYFRYDARQRLGNTTTTRSSVFSIWVTVGYFEVDANGKIGAEMGWDTGKIRRNRGFFIYDRSIPVGFEPGANHNIEKGFLTESYIE